MIRMTREEQKTVREAGKLLNKAIRTCSKKHQYKCIGGSVYKTVNDFIYITDVSIPPSDKGTRITIRLTCKPAALDDIF